jgi:ketopantoate reductase
MNANDIAEELESIHWLQDGAKSKPFQMYADFIRQQQAEIEELLQFIVERGETGQLIIWKAQNEPTNV